MSRTVKYLLFANLVVITGLVFLFPHLMIGPGKLMVGHGDLERECFACHLPLRGSSSDKCVTCHKVASIGITTSKGTPLTLKKTKVPFHQKLVGRDCVACHSDHAGVAQYRVAGRFSHQSLDEATRNQCATCHQRPGDALHRLAGEQCRQCHGLEKWQPAQFQHDLLSAAQRQECASCHQGKAPGDNLHRQTSGKCGQCHTVTQWKPATLDHEKLFAFDRDHHVKCNLCHPRDDYQAYTCYGCHEHSAGKVREEHLEEGIRDFERCVLCHRNANQDDAERLWKSGRWREGAGAGPIPPPAREYRRREKQGHDHDD